MLNLSPAFRFSLALGWRLGIALTIFGVLFGGCSKEKPGVLEVRKILIDLTPGFEREHPLATRDIVRNVMAKFLTKDTGWAFTPEDESASVIRVRLGRFGPSKRTRRYRSYEPRDPEDMMGERWVAKVDLKGEMDSTDVHYMGQASLPYDADAHIVELVEDILTQAMEELALAHLAESVSEDILLGWLGVDAKDHTPKASEIDKGDTEKKLHAIKVLGARGSIRAVPHLKAYLQANDLQVAMAALGALTLIGDASAVSSVTRFAERKPPAIRKQAILAAESMGGKSAAAWLFTMSTGHNDPSVRQAAEAALKVVEGKMPKGEQAVVSPSSDKKESKTTVR